MLLVFVTTELRQIVTIQCVLFSNYATVERLALDSNCCRRTFPACRTKCDIGREKDHLSGMDLLTVSIIIIIITSAVSQAPSDERAVRCPNS